jgi:hypothetical protein
MAKLISASVGRWAANRLPDVKTVQELLNKAGALPPLAVDGMCGPKSNGAIFAFQKAHFGSADGRVDPGQRTIKKLNEFDKPGGRPPGGLSALRKQVITIAKLQATPYPGKVSDLVTKTDTATQQIVREGWKNLQNYFDLTVVGWSPLHWKNKQILAGVQIPGRRIPQPGTSGMQWCGIFATWVWIKAGIHVKWVLGPGISRPYTRGNDFRPGDICVKKGGVVHHCIAISDGDPVQTVNGNSDNQSILIKPIARSQVAYYYKVD